MKRYLYIAIVIILASASANANFGSTKGEDKNQDNQQQGERRKGTQSIIKPDGDFSSQQDQEFNVESDDYENDGVERISDAPFTELNPDSLDDDSVSKYNFIFYFLYKFKYDSE